MPRFHRCNRLPAARTLKAQATVSALIESALVRPRASLSGTDAVAQLADDMRRSETATRADLETMGWTANQLDSLGGKARTRAQRHAGASVRAMRVAPTAIGPCAITGACSEIARRYRAAGYSEAAAIEQAEAFASRFKLPTIEHFPPRVANCNGEADFDATLASIAKAIG